MNDGEPGLELQFDFAVAVERPAATEAETTRPLGRYLRDIVAANPDRFRVFSPDENTSNKLDDYGGRLWWTTMVASCARRSSDGDALGAHPGRVVVLSQ